MRAPTRNPALGRAPAAIGRWNTRHRAALLGCLLAFTLAAGAFVLKSGRFDSEILNLLPSESDAVRALKIYNHEFTQSRELAFFFETPGNPERLQDFREHFLTALTNEPWAIRWMAVPPSETPAGRAGAPGFLFPLVFSLPPVEFDGWMETLDAEEIRDRIARLAPRLRAGSPVALVEWETDPLGLFGRVAQNISASTDLGESLRLTSQDGCAQIVTVITDQEELSAEGCKEMMTRVREFIRNVRQSFGDRAPEVLVTGRSAFVSEIADSMRSDILATSLASLLGVSLLFLLAFRSLLPLFGLSLLLVVASIGAMAAGLAIFSELNLIAIAFCSILFGLGNDFALLLLQQFRLSRGKREHRIAVAVRRRWPGIASVALTTALGFLALALSSSVGFTQLGVLTACGIALCALLIPVFFFLFVGRGEQSESRDAGGKLSGALFGMLARHGLWVALPLLIGASAIAALPWRHVEFDVSPRSLEPKSAPASIALEQMIEAFPTTFDPLIIVVHEPAPTLAAHRLARIEAAIDTLHERGLVLSVSGASAVVTDPVLAARNIDRLREVDWDGVEEAMRQVLDEHGMSLPGEHPAALALSTLRMRPGTLASWESSLPESSPWRFLIDRMVSPSRSTYLIYLKPANPDDFFLLRDEIRRADPGALLTGWSGMLRSLVPWAERELFVFALGVGGAILILLALIYRNFRAWAVHTLGMIFSIALIVAVLKVFQIRINLLNVLAFPLILGVGVDYSTHLLLAALEPGQLGQRLREVLKPVLISGLTTLVGFGALGFATNPSLAGLGAVCATGIASCLAVSFLFVLPLCSWVRAPRNSTTTPILQ